MSADIVPYKEPDELAGLAHTVPAVFLASAKAGERFFEFFTANMRNPNTRRAYYKAACRFSDWGESRGLRGPRHVVKKDRTPVLDREEARRCLR